jgi:glycine betaine/proline transport system substrate-binding protein
LPNGSLPNSSGILGLAALLHLIPYPEEIKGVKLIKIVSRYMGAAVIAMLFSATSANALTIVLGHVNESSYEATAVVIQTVLERIGYNVSIKKGKHSVMYPMLAEGEIDIFVAGSLPNEQATYWEEYKDRLVLVSPLYEDARLFWAVPGYVPASDVKSIADLAKPDVASRMEKTIRGPGADSDLMIRSDKVLQEYGLSQSGYKLSPGKSADWIAAFNANIESGKWFVMPLWQPHYLNEVAKLRILDEPKKLLGKPDTAWLIANKGTRRKIGPVGFGVLQKMELSLRAVTELDYEVNVEKRTPREAGRRWMGMHPYTLEYWLENDE